MKIVLILYICSSVSNTCLAPLKYNETFNDIYSCMLKGYQEGYKWTQRLGKEEVNKNQVYIKFRCLQEKNPLELPL